MTPFPIPVVSLIGPGTQVEDEELSYMSMPQGMQTFASPILPEPEVVVTLKAAHKVLRQVLDALDQAAQGKDVATINIVGLDVENLKLVNQVLGEGEVSARVEGEYSIRIQEAVFAGVWRSVISKDGRVISDQIEVGPVPKILITAAREGARDISEFAMPENMQPNLMNAPSIVTELNEKVVNWKPGTPAHVVNLTLLPLSQEDNAFLEERLIGGCVLILSRGYGNCRIISTLVPNCWRVVYYNSTDAMILNTVEVVDIPEVACAALEDLRDSYERLTEVLEWVEGG